MFLEKVSRITYLWFPPILLCGVIYLFSSIQDMAISSGSQDFILRKMVHFSEYALLGMLVYRALLDGHTHTSARSFVNRKIAVAFVLVALYAASDEYHQLSVPTRNGSWWDIAIDIFGAVSGLLAYACLPRIEKLINTFTHR